MSEKMVRKSQKKGVNPVSLHRLIVLLISSQGLPGRYEKTWQKSLVELKMTPLKPLFTEEFPYMFPIYTKLYKYVPGSRRFHTSEYAPSAVDPEKPQGAL